MAHYAWINENNLVINVTVGVDENEIQQGVGGSTEAWEQFYTLQINQPNVYVKRTSYNGNYRKNYAGIGFTYDANRDAFIPPKPYESWLLDENNCVWIAPIPVPDNESSYVWNELNQSWDLYVSS